MKESFTGPMRLARDWKCLNVSLWLIRTRAPTHIHTSIPPLHLSALYLSLPSFLHSFSLLCFSSLLPFTFSPDYLFPSLFPFHSLQSFLSPLFSPLSILIFLLLRHSYHQSPLPSSACHPHLFYLPRIYRFLSHKPTPLTQSFVGRHSLSSFVPTQFLLARQHVQHTQSVQTT